MEKKDMDVEILTTEFKRIFSEVSQSEPINNDLTEVFLQHLPYLNSPFQLRNWLLGVGEKREINPNSTHLSINDLLRLLNSCFPIEEANPQLENGFLRLANEIVEQLAKQVICPDEWRILLTIFRKSYGWGKKSDWISLSQFCDFTDMKKSNVSRAISKLLKRNIIIRSDNAVIRADKGYSLNYRFQKDYSQWRLPLSKQIKADEIIRSDNESLSGLITTKEKKKRKEKNKHKAKGFNDPIAWYSNDNDDWGFGNGGIITFDEIETLYKERELNAKRR